MHAKDAKTIADTKNLLKPYLESVEKAAQMGAYKVVMEKQIPEIIKSELTKLGFNIGIVTQYRPEPLGSDIPYDFDCISWEK